ncbi:TolB family protein [candidate division KSB1 bacterium]
MNFRLKQFCCVSVLLGAACGGLTSPESIPDGDILYLREIDGASSLFIYDLELGSALKVEVDEPLDGNLVAARWSPDKRNIIASSALGYKDKEADLYMLEAGKRSFSRIADSVDYLGFCWSADSESFAYTWGRPLWGVIGPGELFTYRFDGCKDTKLTNTPERSERVADWLPGGRGERWLVSVINPISRPDSLFVFEPAAGSWGLVHADDVFMSPRVSSDGRLIAYRGRDSIRMIESDGGGGYTLLPQAAALTGVTGGPVWSPDGGKLLYSRKNPIGCGMYYMDVESGEFTTLFRLEDENVSINPMEWR